MQYMRQGRLRQAEALQKRIVRTRSVEKEHRLRGLSADQAREKRAVSAAHRNEMKHLHRLWQDYFHQLRQREIDILESFQTFRKQEIRTAR